MSKHPSKHSEAMDVGLEGPLKPSSSSAAAVAEYKRVQEALEPPGHCCEAVLFGKLEFIWLESPSKPLRGRLLPQLQRKLFQAQLMDCICKWHPAEFTHPGEADPLHTSPSFCFLVLQPLPGYDSLSQEEMKVQQLLTF